MCMKSFLAIRNGFTAYDNIDHHKSNVLYGLINLLNVKGYKKQLILKS